MEIHVLIIGAGVSGLTAAKTLSDQGMKVTLLDKGRGVGGRVATRWMGERDHVLGRWDHGAQFATFRSESLIKQLRAWNAWDVLEPWIPSYSDPELPRYRSITGMNSFPKAMAKGLNIHRGCRITRLENTEGQWKLYMDSEEPILGSHLLCTLPVPQFTDLLEASPLSITAHEHTTLKQVVYERTLTLLAELDGPSGLEGNGYVRASSSGILETLIDQHQKSISAAHTLVANAKPAFSMEWYDRDRTSAASVIRAAVQEKICSQIISVQIHGWKFAKAVQRISKPYMSLENKCILAGDGFEAGDQDVASDLHPRIESAMLSGRAAARHLIKSMA